jgi:hypothetical protein
VGLLLVCASGCAGTVDADGASVGSDDIPEAVAGTTTTVLAKSIRRHDITWTLDKVYPVGQYINGDYFVVAPADGITVVRVAPAPSNGRNGSGVNVLAQTQPADSRAPLYVPGPSYPITLQRGDALISFKSATGTEVNDCGPDAYRNQGGYCESHNNLHVLGASVLTVVSVAPPPSSFRPAALGDASNRLTYSLPTIDAVVSALPSLAATNQPDIATLIRSRERFQFEAITSWARRYSAPADNQATYSAYSKNSDVLLALATNYPAADKRKLLIAVLQDGIDLVGRARIAPLTNSDGGHGENVNSVLAVTSQLMAHSTITSFVKALPPINGDKGHTYVGVNGVALFGKVCPDPAQYASMCNGTYTSGAKDCRDPAERDDDLTRPGCVGYQSVDSPHYPGQALAMALLNAVDDYNHRPFFQYADRWMALDGSTASTFVAAMWTTYRAKVSW